MVTCNSQKPSKIGSRRQLGGKIIGSKENQLSGLYHQSVKRKSIKILPDQTAFETLPSGRRPKVPLARKKLLQALCYSISHHHFKF